MTARPDEVAPPELADRVAAAALSVPGVHALHSGVAGEVATYLPGRRVEGVRLRDDSCAVHVSIAYGESLATTTDLVRGAVAPLVGVPVDVTVEDVVAPVVRRP